MSIAKRPWAKRATGGGSYKPVITERPKEDPKWKVTSRILWKKFNDYPTKKLVGIAGGGLVIIIMTAVIQFKIYQYRLFKSDSVQLALEKFNQQKQLGSILGLPCKCGYCMPTYKNSIQDDHVNARITIEGTYVDGFLTFEASKKDDKSWVLNDMQFQFADEAGGIVQLVKKNQ